MSAPAWLLFAAFIAGAMLAWFVSARAARRRAEPDSNLRDEDATPSVPIDVALGRIVGALRMGIILLDRSLQIRYANQAAGAIFGFDPERAPGTHLLRSVPNVELERRALDALYGEASVAPLALTAPAAQRTYRVSVAPLEPENTPGIVVFIEDQTELARLERSSREFLSNVSHELRTPLSSVKLMLETVAAAPDDEARDLFVPQALAEVDRLAALVGRLLEQARTESGRLKLDLSEVDLEEVARQTVAPFDPRAAQKGVQLQVQAIRPVRVEADRDRVSQVLVNLVDNALRHTGQGGTVAVELDAQGNEAIVRVRDTGEGIPYRDLPNIFERFYVADRSRARETGGAGLGLAIVKGIVDAHGGAITAESALGSGTAITIRLPIVRMRA